LTVTHSAGSYEIRFTDLGELRNLLPSDAFVITDSNVAAHYAGLLESTQTIVVPAGEQSKSVETYASVLEKLANLGAKRNSWVVAFGGGVVGDLAGFAAATYMRGVKLLQVPTSLLAMVDSSVGGKVGIDLCAGKNLAGAFYPPQGVLIAEEFLKTLPERHVANGLAEVVKYAYISDPDILGKLREPALDFGWIVRRSLEIKSDIVAKDEFETTGLRATLNFGHTIGHAIEKCLNYEHLLHGEAVAIGMVMEARLGEQLNITPEGSANQIAADCDRLGLPVELPSGLPVDEMLSAMRRDKKVLGSGFAFSLLTGVGTCKLCSDVDPGVVQRVIASS